MIDYRKSVTRALQLHSGAVRAIRGGDVDYPDHILTHAVALEGLSDMLLVIFREDVGEGDTRALPGIWESASEFRAHIEETRSAATNLVSAARTGDGAEIDKARDAVGQSCLGCHRIFRARPPR